MPRKTKSVTGSPTADFLGRAIALSGMTQREIARRAGYDKPNVISMMKMGQTKVPIDRIPDIAEACGVDPARFMRIALQEYHPELLELVLDYVGELLTINEMKIVRCYRGIVGDDDDEIEVDTEAKLALMTTLHALRDRRKRRGR